MRRISRGAANKIRRRQSSTHRNERDRSSGPVVMRRSDSKSTAASEIGDFDRAEDAEEAVADSLGIYGLGSAAINGFNPDPRSPNVGDYIAPVVPLVLQQGMFMAKVTKKNRKTSKFFLDTESAKVCWDEGNPSKRIHIDDIIKIRGGEDARNYREEYQVPLDVEKRFFTVLYVDSRKGRGTKTIHLIAPDDQSFELWTTTLEEIRKYRESLMASLAGAAPSDKVIAAHWKREMDRIHRSGSEAASLDLTAVETLCRNLHVNCSKDMLKAQFKKADLSNSGRLIFEEFKHFIRVLKERRDIKEVFNRIAADSKKGITAKEFLTFLGESQGIDITTETEHWRSVFQKYARESKATEDPEKSPVPENQLRMNLLAFSSFLLSSYNGIHSPPKSTATFDRPLNEYFISSSHNTYLLGRQVAGESSTEPYISALEYGCRCVEIDCWDGPDGRPIVSHGRTLTSSILFQDCITVIEKYAFKWSPYPLILSLEVHCNPVQQHTMTAIMKQIFGEKLLTEPIDTREKLPSPEMLKNKILVKVKAANDAEESSLNVDPFDGGRKRSSSSPYSRPIPIDTTQPLPVLPLSGTPSMSPPEYASPFWTTPRRSMTATSMSSASDDSDGMQDPILAAQSQKKRVQGSNIVPVLAKLGVYTQSQKWSGSSPHDMTQFNHICSFAERAFENVCRDDVAKNEIERHNVRYLARVYPSGFRVKSSNFDPNTFWRRGVQMVALNWQTYDTGMQINRAMFAAGSDQLGYVVKPEELRRPRKPVDTTDETNSRPAKIERKRICFSVQVISAQQLPRPRNMNVEENLNPYVEVEMLSAEDKSKGIATGEGGMDASSRNGLSGIGYPHRRRTRIEQSNGYSPNFNETFKLSLDSKYPSLVFVRWTVYSSPDGRRYDNNSVRLATYTAKLSSLQQGYRHIPLYDGSGDRFLFSTLFCKIKVEEAVTVSESELEEMKSERQGIFKQLGQAVFKRSLSVERRASQDERYDGVSELPRLDKAKSKSRDKVIPPLPPTQPPTSHPIQTPSPIIHNRP